MGRLVDLACAIHAHSRYSDGSGTVPQIAAAARRAGLDAVLLTDHDTLEARHRGEEGWHGDVLICVGMEISRRRSDHYLAFGLEHEIDGSDLSAREIVAAVAEAGGFGFIAHPFSRGSERFRRLAGIPWTDFEDPGIAGIELWSFVTDTAESLRSLREIARFLATPARTLVGPPAPNVAGWDRLCRRGRVVAIAGVDAHQIGLRIGDRVPLRLMAYHRSFAHLRTHALVERAPSGDAERDRDALYAALREGCCYMAVDSLAPARGFELWADADGTRVEMGGEGPAAGATIQVRLPRPARTTLYRDGVPILTESTAQLEHRVEAAGVHRVEAKLQSRGRERTWILSNPLYLRQAGGG